MSTEGEHSAESAWLDVTDYGALVQSMEARYAALWAENERLIEALREAREDVESWGAYASDYFQEKWNLAGDLARIDAVLAEHFDGTARG